MARLDVTRRFPRVVVAVIVVVIPMVLEMNDQSIRDRSGTCIFNLKTTLQIPAPTHCR